MVLVKITLGEGASEVRGGLVVGIHLWSPPDKPQLKYPFIVYDYSPFRCLKWRVNTCEIQEGEFPEGGVLYLHSIIPLGGKRAKKEVKGLYPVREGYKFTEEVYTFGARKEIAFEAENLGEPYLTTKTIELLSETIRSKLIREAYGRGWSISYSKFEDNLLAVYAVVNKLIPEVYVTPKPEAKLETTYEVFRRFAFLF